MKNIIIKKWILILLLILVANMVSGCISSDSSPSEVVNAFYNSKNYSLMSEEYKNSTDLNNFTKAIANCNSNPTWGGSNVKTTIEFIGVKEESEIIEGDLASVEIIYTSQDPEKIQITPSQETKKINFIKEKDGWRLKDLYCELSR